MGPSKSLDVGIRKALKLNADILVTVDADGQHPIVNFKKIIKNMLFYDLIIFSQIDQKTRNSEKYVILS